jgi:RNA polymerase sigma-70 factor (ECF subfamily)
VRIAALALVLAAGPAQAAVEHTHDTEKGGFDVAALTFDATIDPGEDRYLVAALLSEGPAVRSATYAGMPLGLIAAASSPGGHCRTEWWGLAAPPVGTGSFQAVWSGPSRHTDATLLGYQGVASLGSFAMTTGNGSDGPTQLTVASAPGEVVLDLVCGWAPDSLVDMAGSGQITHWHWSSENISSAISDRPGADTVTMTWTDSGPGTMEWSGAGVALRATGRRVAVDLAVHGTGCGLGGRGETAGILPALLAVAFLGLLARRTGRGTSGDRSRGTSSFMRLHASRPAVAPVPAPEPELDGVTLARAKAGDRRAQAAIVHRYERPVFSLLWRMIGPQPAVVEDLTQETFLRVLRALERFEDDGRARMVTWVLSIASRLAIDHLRACRPHRDVTIVPGALPVALPTPEYEVNRRALGAALIQAVDSLSPPFRAAFLLREVHGLTYDEIGLALDIDVGTVKSRLARARAALQAALAEMRDE